MMNKFKIFSLFTLSLCFLACTPTKKITYDYTQIESLKDSVSIDNSFSVFILEDVRKGVEDSEKILDSGRLYGQGNDRICINSDKHYTPEKTVARQVSEAIHYHIKQTDIFENMAMNTDEMDYSLKGSVMRLYGEQKFSKRASAAQSFGLIGAIATADIKSPGKIRITLTNLRLVDNKSNMEIPLDDIDLQFEGQYRIDGDCWFIYDHVNEYLKETIRLRLIPNIIEKIASLN
tara:strand:+ start:20546 stop:21244 length:699 start_codon:yes stop_codon:yes gene_type:complete